MVNLDYLYNPDAAKKAFEKDYFINKKLGFRVIENGMILPHKKTEVGGLIGSLGGIVDSKGDFVKGSFVAHSRLKKSYTPQKESIQYSSETVVYLGYFYPVWGHVITDNIRRIWFLDSEIFKSQFKNYSLVYIPWPEAPLDSQQNFKRLLEILEVDIRRWRPITKPTQFEKIILPDESFEINGFTSEYRETIDRIRNFALKNRTPTLIDKIYYFHGKRQVGEDCLAEYFKSKGYEIISPEKLTLDEQLNLLINCKSFASTLGSSSHNSVFLRNGAETIFIPRAANQFPFYQSIIDQVHEQNVNYVDSSLAIFYTRNGPFCYIISEQLKKFFGDKFDGYNERNLRTFLQYIKNSLSKNLVLDKNSNEYYKKILNDFFTQLKQREDLIEACDMSPGWEKLRPLLKYQIHVTNKGWGNGWKSENEFSNPLDQNLEVQAIKLSYPSHKVYYSVYFNDKEGWSAEVQAPEMAGTVGVRKPIYGMRIRFDEAGSKEFDILYRMHKFDDTWTPWAKNGEALYSHGVKLNAIQIKLEPKT